MKLQQLSLNKILVFLSFFLLCFTTEVVNAGKVHFLATGSSDAILIESNGIYALVDSSNPSSIDSNHNGTSVANYLKARGITKLDYLIITHSHSDHNGGVPELVSAGLVNSSTVYIYKHYVTTNEDNIHPDWDNKGYYDRAMAAIESVGAVKKDIANSSFSLDVGGVNLTFYNTTTHSDKDENANSLGIMVNDSGNRIFLSSDIDNTYGVESSLISQIGKVDVLKLAHHGGANATTLKLLQELSPDSAVITSNIKLYIPQLAYLRELGTEVYKTQYGEVILDSSNLYYEKGGYCTEKLENNWMQWIYVGWTYINEDGYLSKGLQMCPWSGGKDYFYFDSNGIMQTGLQSFDYMGKQMTSYFDPVSGAMYRDRCIELNGEHLCFDSTGNLISEQKDVSIPDNQETVPTPSENETTTGVGITGTASPSVVSPPSPPETINPPATSGPSESTGQPTINEPAGNVTPPENPSTSPEEPPTYQYNPAIKMSSCEKVEDVMEFLNALLKIVQLLVPILLIIMGSIDLLLAVLASDEKRMKVSTSKFVKRCLAAIIVFFIPLIVDILFSLPGVPSASDLVCGIIIR